MNLIKVCMDKVHTMNFGIYVKRRPDVVEVEAFQIPLSKEIEDWIEDCPEWFKSQNIWWSDKYKAITCDHYPGDDTENILPFQEFTIDPGNWIIKENRKLFTLNDHEFNQVYIKYKEG